MLLPSSIIASGLVRGAAHAAHLIYALNAATGNIASSHCKFIQ